MWILRSCHDANFVVAGDTWGCHYDATSDDNVGIMVTLVLFFLAYSTVMGIKIQTSLLLLNQNKVDYKIFFYTFDH